MSAPAAPRSPLARAWDTVWPPVLVLVLVLVVWEAAIALYDIKPFYLPRPLAVYEKCAAWPMPSGEGNALWHATLQTGAAAGCGFLASMAIGTLLALAFAGSSWLRRGVYPYTIFFQTVPVVAIAPLVILWFGTGFPSVVIVAFVLSVFPVISNATQGLTRVDSRLLELFASYGATRLQLLLKLRLPGSVPYLVAGARVASGLAVIGAIVGEFFVGYGTDHFGLGYQIQATSGQMNTARLFGAIAASTALGLALFGAVGTIGRLVLARWSPEQLDH